MLNAADSIDNEKNIIKLITDFITTKKGFSFVTFNCQSLRSHALDRTDSVIRNSNLLLLIETWMSDEEDIMDVPDFNCTI